MLIEFRMASFNCVAFWKIDADDDRSPLLFRGGPRGGNSGCCRVGVTTFEFGFEWPERLPDEELEPELRDLFSWGSVFVLFTTLLDGCRCLGSAGVALVNVSVKYCVSSMLQIEIIQDAWIAFAYELFLSGACNDPLRPWTSGAMTTSTVTSCTVVPARFVLLRGATFRCACELPETCARGPAVGVVWPLPPSSCSLLTIASCTTQSRKSYNRVNLCRKPLNPSLVLTSQDTKIGDPFWRISIPRSPTDLS